MQEVDVLKRRMMEEKFEQESTGATVTCGNGCEFTVLEENISLRERLILGDYIHANNLCPFCRTENGRVDFQFCVENQHKMIAVEFQMNDKLYKTIYKPSGYKFLPPQIAEDNE